MNTFAAAGSPILENSPKPELEFFDHIFLVDRVW